MATSADTHEHAHTTDPGFNLAHCMHTAMVRHGKSMWAQLREIWRLRLGPGKLQPDEYYYYGLYDDGRYSFADKARFLGRTTQDRIIRACNPLDWWLLAHDKLVFYGLVSGMGLPVPATRALYHPNRSFGTITTLTSAEALAAHLRQGIEYPFFGKPVTGMRSVGVTAAEGYDHDADAIRFAHGRSQPVEAYVRELERYRQDGYLFQEMLRPHPAVAAICGARLSTVRLIVLMADGQPTILHALWKIPVADNPADNFWRPGNLLAGLDPDGQVTRIIQGTGPDQVELERHPDTDQPLEGVQLPDWQALTELCLRAATAVPGLRMQAWDLALTDRGPMLIEVNIGGDFNLPQLAHATGLLDDRFRSFLDDCRTQRAKPNPANANAA